ncbi:hypothetical protein L207DRAFT_505926 [Hyaloscypha variabilis F]|uniref:P-loop containing nucleoside triphosphate hydrolase protein n=1 Tax=Hyaloscypha variabilis (strain UAMH 11265 / GT02V1 / F) TaxID=1149755 RepID=A0A2J6SDR7_HYAVF|nr:hypothetical protein L207DRAFT_505926 [Hyaloscypha variabilis F]
MTFSWSSDLLDRAATKIINVGDLPAMTAFVRSAESIIRFRSTSLKPTVALWKVILWNFRFRFLRQWILVTVLAIIDALPQYAILRLLQYLEARQNFDTIDPKAWLWVGVLLVSTLTFTLVNNRITWFMISELSIPARSILTTLLFEKMMKVKDCKDPPKSEKRRADEAPKSNGSNQANKANPNADGPKKASRQTKHQLVNMFAVDANLVAVFCANSQFYVNYGAKVIVSTTFLWLLIGWKSLFAGLVAIVILIGNSFLAKKYQRNQKALVKSRDTKTAVVTEALHGVRQIKFSAAEAQWMEKINEAREVELGRLWQTMRSNILITLASNIAPILLVAFVLATYAYIHGDLLPSIAFTALGVFGQLEAVLVMTLNLLVMGLNAKISCDRIDSFLQSEERVENTQPGDSIVFENASVSFPSDSKETLHERFILRDVSLQFPKHALSVISGPTGSGKSLLLAAILGEVELLAGNIRVPRPPTITERFDAKATAANWILPSAIAFVSQTPWIENTTIKANVLFGLPCDAVRYEKVLNACSLTKDLEMFEDGDLTEVGAQGISLSGGQKWRLTLARAFYSRAGILILDDVFSVIDAHVGREIYDNALMGELSEGRTRILVTHHVSLCLPRTKYAVSLSSQGTIKHAGLVEELKKTGSFEDMLMAEQEENTNEATKNGESSGTAAKGKASGSATKHVESKYPKLPPKKLVKDEHRESGSVKRSVYSDYLKATGGVPFWTLVILFYVIAQGLTLGRSWWIRIWTASYLLDKSHMARRFHTYTDQRQLFAPLINSTATLSLRSSPRGLGFYLGVYVLISLVSIIFTTGRFFLVFRGSLRASRKVFREMTYRVLHTPLRWLDTEPTGRILNRFTADFQLMDSQLSSDFAQNCASLVQVLGIMVAAFFVSPYFIFPALALLVACVHIARRYIRGARAFKRLESAQKSPIVLHFSSSLQGLSTIHGFSNAQVFVTRMHNLIDSSASTTWHNGICTMWLGFRMGIVGSIFSSVIALFTISIPGVDAGLAGFALTFSLEFRSAFLNTVRQLANTELDMNAAERIFEYTKLETEDLRGGTNNLRASWPEEGKLEVKKLEVGYANDLPAILKGVTFSVEGNQRVGVVGRTGAGKSTLSLALFRFLKARKGSIVIDGIDISTIKLHDLRTRLAIIPQDPVLFSGSIRSNLDPFNNFSDVQLKEVLERVQLITSTSTDNTLVSEPVQPAAEASSIVVSSITAAETGPKENANIFLDSNSAISQSGSNISQGQR